MHDYSCELALNGCCCCRNVGTGVDCALAADGIGGPKCSGHQIGESPGYWLVLRTKRITHPLMTCLLSAVI